MYNDQEHLRREYLSDRRPARLAIVSLTQTCDLACRYCRPAGENWYDRLAMNSSSRVLQRQHWSNLIELCHRNNVREILLTGGEPSLYPGLKDFLKLLRDERIFVSFHTHGLYKGWNALLDFLDDNRIRCNFHISSELFEDHQRTYRGCGMPFEFIKRLAERGRGVELKVVLHHQHLGKLGQFEDALKKWRDIGVNSIRFQPITPGNIPIPKELVLTSADVPIFSFLKSLKDKFEYVDLIRNSADSFNASIKVITNDFVDDIAEQCSIKDKILFWDTDLSQSDCMSLWGKSRCNSCSQHFDLVCCGYQA